MKIYEVHLKPDAIDDLSKIYTYIADESKIPEVAWNYIQKPREKYLELSNAPIRGQKRDDLRKNLRIVPIDKNAVAAFEVNEEKATVTIFNIFYGGRDYDTIMNSK